MKKNTIYLLLILFSPQLFAQIDSTKISFVAYWSKGDSYDFKVTKIKRNWNGDSLVKKDSSQYIVNFKVLDSTDKSYTIQWKYKNNLVNTFLKKADTLFNDKKALNQLLSKNEITEILYKTDELGEFTGIINWKEISELTTELLTELEISIKENYPEKFEKIQNAMKPLLQIYSSKEGIEQLIVPEIQFFHYPFGVEYDISEPIKFEQELPNMFGGDPITGDATITFEDIDFEESYCVMKEETKINPEESKNLIATLFQKMGKSTEDIKKFMENAVLDISDLNYFQYYYNPGIPHRVYNSREVFVSVDGKEHSELKEMEIELIYEE